MPSPDKMIYPEGKDCSKCVHCQNIILAKCKCDIKGDIEPDPPLMLPFTWGDDAKDCAEYKARPEFEEAERMVETVYPEGRDCFKCIWCRSIDQGVVRCSIMYPIMCPATQGVIAAGCPQYKERPESKEAERMVDIYLVLVQDEKGIDRIVGARMDAMAAGEMLTKSTTDESGERIAEGHIEVWDAGAFTTDILVVLGAKGGADMDVLGVYGTRQGADRMAQRGMNDGLRIKVEEWGVLE